MKKLILTEEEKQNILKLYGLINEESGCGEGGFGYSQAPSVSDIMDNDSKIKFREKGDSVKEVQRALINLNYKVGKCKDDGLYGPKTMSAVKKFQSDNSMKETGEVNKETLVKLKNPSTSKNKTSTNLEDENESNVSSDDNYVIVKSDSYEGKDVHVFFGGAHSVSSNGANIPYLNKVAKIVKPYSDNVIIVLTHHANSLNKVEKYVKEKFDGKIVSIAGFSQGGRETWEHATDGSLRLVGLIDPSTYDIDLDMGPNTVMVCNPSNWGGYAFVDAVKKRLKWYCEHKDDPKYSGKIECTNVSHWGFLNYFYSKFGSRI